MFWYGGCDRRGPILSRVHSERSLPLGRAELTLHKRSAWRSLLVSSRLVLWLDWPFGSAWHFWICVVDLTFLCVGQSARCPCTHVHEARVRRSRKIDLIFHRPIMFFLTYKPT